ncbi:MAG: TetR/AcrR family transcriptional regulator [Magnetococcales bacterium]|nr:TetR/AcrR family transcriptional regulator [Magnetococcales bacterium]
MNEKKQRILDAAITLFAKDGFWNTSTASISKEAGVATGTLFNHFSSKDALINAVYVSLKKEIHTSIMAIWQPDGTLKKNLLAAWSCVIHWGLKNQDRYDLMEQLRMSERVSQETREAMAAEFSAFQMDIQMGVAEAVLEELPVAYHMQACAALMSATLIYLRSPEGGSADPDALINSAFAAYWHGVAQ